MSDVLDAGVGPAPAQEADLTIDERKLVGEVLRGEYSVLLTALTASWSVSMSRTSLFLGVLSAAGVALGFAAQGGGGFGPPFFVFALVILPVTLFLGIATFLRQVQIQRESIVYVIGMNRIRHFLVDSVPAAAPYLVLSTHDDELSLYRNLGAGMSRRPPRLRLGFVIVQTQGVVAVVCGVIAGAIAGLAAAWAAVPAPSAWLLAAGAFLALVAALLAYWSRSIRELQASIRPLWPTPPESLDAPF
jgi:hypothetical protein